MSMDVAVNSELSTASSGVGGQLSELTQNAVLDLNPAERMPLTFNERWNAAAAEFADAVASNVDGFGARFVEASGGSKGKLKRMQRVRKPWFTWATVGAFVGAWGFFISMALTGNALALISGVFAAFAPFTLVIMIVDGGIKLRALGEDARVFFEEKYQERVSQWARERYGVEMLNRWDSQLKRLAGDIVYVADKGGEPVYCFETDTGWVLGYRDGTELPVLTEMLASV